jgi:hypothetical protein
MITYIVLHIHEDGKYLKFFENRDAALDFYEYLKKNYPIDFIEIYIKMT